ncbi:MAG: hypothetical protein LUC37_02935 [Prevotella sp.]|nr:hypothetical protein [Prevotella sp.]
MIGARILVYNPGDLPVDWEIRFNENKRAFWSSRGGEKFRIRRFNVERLSIPDAVDWCGLTTYDMKDNEPFKYGSLYFKRRTFDRDRLIENIQAYGDNLEIYKPDGATLYTQDELIDCIKGGHMFCDKHWNDEDGNMNMPYEDWNTTPEEYRLHRADADWLQPLEVAFNLHLNDYPELFEGVLSYSNLGEAHPHHCYYAEPIPREMLGHFIKLFYWQTIQWRGNKTYAGEWVNLDLWKEMMPKDFWIDPDIKNQIKDVTHPLVNFIRMFNVVNLDGTLGDPITTYREKMIDLNFEEGIAMAARYDELRSLCLDEQEEF